MRSIGGGREAALTAGMLLAAAFCGGALASLLLGAPARAQGGEALSASQVNLVDAGGVLRGVLSARDERGQASLAFYDAQGQTRARLGVDPQGEPALELRNAAGEARLAAAVTRGDALLTVGDERAAHGALGASAGVPLLSFGAGQQARLQLQMGADGRPSVVLAGADGQRSAALSMDSEDAPLLTLYHAGRARLTLGVVQEAAVINVSGPQQSRVVVGVAADGFPSVSVTLYDEAGELVGTLPQPQAR